MTANFFQSLDRNGVEYLLISGQATVLYGAATFSEDIDLWVNPTEENRDRLITALTENQARYYKLTPPLSGVGHKCRIRPRLSFHFTRWHGWGDFSGCDGQTCRGQTDSLKRWRRLARCKPNGDWFSTVGIMPLVESQEDSTAGRLSDNQQACGGMV